MAEYPLGAGNVWFWPRRPDRQDSYASAALIEAIFVVLGLPDLDIRQCPLAPRAPHKMSPKDDFAVQRKVVRE